MESKKEIWPLYYEPISEADILKVYGILRKQGDIGSSLAASVTYQLREFGSLVSARDDLRALKRRSLGEQLREIADRVDEFGNI